MLDEVLEYDPCVKEGFLSGYNPSGMIGEKESAHQYRGNVSPLGFGWEGKISPRKQTLLLCLV